MPWRAFQDEFGKFCWIDHEGRIYQGTPYAVEPGASARMVFLASMMHAQMQKPSCEQPDATCPDDAVDTDHRQ